MIKTSHCSYMLFHPRKTASLVSMLLLLTLSACSEQAAVDTAEASNSEVSANLSSKPSLSAAELSNDFNHSIQSAMSVADGEEPKIIAGVSQALLEAQSQTVNVSEVSPDELKGGTELPTIETLEQEPAPAEPAPAEPAPAEPAPAEPAPAEPAPAEPEPAEPEPAEPEPAEPEPAEPEPAEPAPAEPEPAEPEPAEPEPTQQGNSSSPSDGRDEPTGGDSDNTQFTSVTTTGFEGEVLEETIRISWQADAGARGYNVYRQAEYITTVFDTEYIDEDVFDGSYYYEIQAFDFDDELYYIATGLTVVASTLNKKDPDAPAANAELLNDYQLVFSDEFNGNSLDTSKWNTSFLWGPGLFINSEEQYYVDVVNDPNFGFNPFTFDGEFMTINSIKTPIELQDKALQQPYLSGLITSYDSFKFTYGYVETRARMTHGRGYWPAFWLLNAYYVDAKPEIDIMEFIGDNQDVVYHTYHYFDADGNLRSTETMPTTGIDFTADFHTFGVEWLPGTLVFYIDGIERHRVTDPSVSSQEMYVLANTAIGGWWAGSPDETTPFPGKYELDYIRVYQKTLPFDDLPLDNGQSNIPLATETTDNTPPNHRPPKELWPEGYPDGT